MGLATDDPAIVYGLEHPGRTLATQQGQTERVRFFVGTQSLVSDNQVYVVEFDDYEGRVHSQAFPHLKGEIWHLATHPALSDILATAYNHYSDGKIQKGVSIWQVPITEQDSVNNVAAGCGPPTMEELLQLDNLCSSIVSVLWNPHDNRGLAVCGDDHVQLWDVNVGQWLAQPTISSIEGSRGHKKISGARWSPHHNATQLALATGPSIVGLDVRSMKEVYCIEHASDQLVRDMDFNPNRQYYMASGGNDGNVKFWDLRMSKEPLLALCHHTHWVWCVRYNHFHDQLVLSASSDSQVVLCRVLSLSSEPMDGTASDSEGQPREVPQDGIVRRYEEHEDSVYVAEWSVVDPWVFASLSYDGRLVINHVPKKEKYRILL